MSAHLHVGFIALLWSVAASSQAIDGTQPLACEAEKGHDCLANKAECSKLKPESKIEPVVHIDFAKREVRSPYRTQLLTVVHAAATEESLILQGGEERGIAWSALIKKKDGSFTISIADREGAYVVFGTCKAEKPS